MKKKEKKKNHLYEVRIHNRNLRAFIKDGNVWEGYQTFAILVLRHRKGENKN